MCQCPCAVTVNSGGHLAPGVALPGTLGTGDLSLLGGSRFDVELTPTLWDMVDVTGSVNVDDAILDLMPPGNFDLFGGSEYVIVQNDGDVDPITGTLFAGQTTCPPVSV